MIRRWAPPPDPAVAVHLERVDPAMLDDASTTGVDLTGVPLAELTGAHLESSELHDVRAGGGQWSRVTLADCRMDGADLANLVWRDGSLLRCALREVRMTGVLLAGVRIRSTTLDTVHAPMGAWHQVRLERVELRDCSLRESTFADVSWTSVRLTGCDLSGADLGGLRCSDVELRDCRLAGVRGVSGLRGMTIPREDAWDLLDVLTREAGVTLT